MNLLTSLLNLNTPPPALVDNTWKTEFGLLQSEPYDYENNRFFKLGLRVGRSPVSRFLKTIAALLGKGCQEAWKASTSPRGEQILLMVLQAVLTATAWNVVPMVIQGISSVKLPLGKLPFGLGSSRSVSPDSVLPVSDSSASVLLLPVSDSSASVLPVSDSSASVLPGPLQTPTTSMRQEFSMRQELKSNTFLVVSEVPVQVVKYLVLFGLNKFLPMSGRTGSSGPTISMNNFIQRGELNVQGGLPASIPENHPNIEELP